MCRHISTGLYRRLSAQRLSELPLPCVTVCHHISAALYRSLSTQRLSEFSLPCVTMCHHISAALYRSLIDGDFLNFPSRALPCAITFQPDSTAA